MSEIEKQQGFGFLSNGEDLPEPEEAPDEVQAKAESDRKRGGFEVDPDSNAFPVVNLGAKIESISWKDENERSIWEDAVVYRPNSSKTKQLEGLVVGLSFVIIRLRSGYFHFDNVNKEFLCKTIAAFPEDGEEFNTFSDLPLSEPTVSPSEYNDQTTPTRQVVRKGTYGSKGMFCADCVRQGLNVKYVEDESGESQPQYCKGTGDILVAVTGVYVKFADKKTNTETAIRYNFDEIYDESEEEPKQLFEAPPIVRLRPTQKVMNLKTKFEVWTKEGQSSSEAKPSANFVPGDVQNIATYDRSLYEEALPDGKSWVRMIKEDDGGYSRLYLGEHELFLADRTEDCELPSQLVRVPMMRASDRNQDILDSEEPVRLLKKASYGYHRYYQDVLRNKIEEKGINPRKPFTPPELQQEEAQPSIAESTTATDTKKAVQESFDDDDS